MKIYTRTGDAGRTGLLGGGRVPKTSLRIAAIGDVDELNAALGLAISMGGDEPLSQVQGWLFDLGAELAAPPGGKLDRAFVGAEATAWLESRIDLLTDETPPLRAFILPGGGPPASALHLARAVCRRAERSILALHAHEEVRANALAFVNRLSDYLFAAARAANARSGVPDVEWHPSPRPC